jgi:uncharacterized protein YukE
VGAGAKTVSALAPFAYDWVGGDIRGLSAYAETLYGYGPRIDDVASALGSKVGQTVGAAGWQGAAASAFTTAWNRDAEGSNALAALTSSIGDVVNWTAVNLSQLESVLERAADEAESHGVPIGSDGQPPDACLANPTAEAWRVSYQAVWNEVMHDAVEVRNTAAGALQRTFDGITGSDLHPGDRSAYDDVIAGFLGAQTRFRAYVEGKIPGLKQEITDAKVKAIADARQADGRFGKWSDENRGEFKNLKSELESVEGKVAEAKSGENWFSKAWGFSPSDIKPVGAALDGMDGVAGRLARFAGDIPVVDVAAVGLGTYFSAQADMNQFGVPSYYAYPGEAAGNVAALAAGGFVGGLATGGVAAGLGALGASGVGVGLAAGGAGVLVGGVVAYGVGDLVHNMIDENWSQDIHNDGVVVGVADGTWHSVENTGKDMANLGKSVWHGISSIF